MTLDRNALKAAYAAAGQANEDGDPPLVAGIIAYLAALPEPAPAEVEGLCGRLEKHAPAIARHSRKQKCWPGDNDFEDAASLLSEAAATIRALAAENGRLKTSVGELMFLAEAEHVCLLGWNKVGSMANYDGIMEKARRTLARREG